MSEHTPEREFVEELVKLADQLLKISFFQVVVLALAIIALLSAVPVCEPESKQNAAAIAAAEGE